MTYPQVGKIIPFFLCLWQAQAPPDQTHCGHGQASSSGTFEGGSGRSGGCQHGYHASFRRHRFPRNRSWHAVPWFPGRGRDCELKSLSRSPAGAPQDVFFARLAISPSATHDAHRWKSWIMPPITHHTTRNAHHVILLGTTRAAGGRGWV